MPTKRQQRIMWVTAAIIAAVTVAFTAAEIYRDTDYLDAFVDLKVDLTEASDSLLSETPDHRLYQVELRDTRGLEVVGYLKMPQGSDGPYPALLALGGVRTGKHVLDYVEDTRGVVILALDYPYKGKKSSLGAWEFIRKIPAIRRALFNTVPASMLAVDYLLQRGDIDSGRIVFVGGSVGALFGPVVGAADKRIDAVAILFGAADLRSILRVNIGAPAPFAVAGAWLASLLISPLEPEKYVGRIAPRPVFMLNGTGDDRMPIHNSEALHNAAGEPKTIRWIDTGHLDIRSTEFHEHVTDLFIDWLVESDLITPAQVGDTP